MKIFLLSVGALVLTLATGCTSILKTANSDADLRNEEAEKVLKISDISGVWYPGYYVKLPGPPPQPLTDATPLKAEAMSPRPAPGGGPAVTESAAAVGAAESNVNNRNTNKPLVGKKNRHRQSKVSSSDAVTVVAPVSTPPTRQPTLEDSEGFSGRRPIVDPFRVGEKVTLDASYFAVSAGDISFSVQPFVAVDGRKSYHFSGEAQSTSVFAMFYAVADAFETFVDFETMVPYSYAVHVKETKQLRESRCIFDWQKLEATFWDKRITKERGIKNEKDVWSILPYSQNVFTALYYLRTFKLTVGKKISYRVAHEKENLVLTAEVLRKEHISTPAGEFDTVVTKPSIELNGVFKPVGDIFIWLTDDDRKLLVRVESKLKIGKVVAVAKKIEYGEGPK